MRLMPAPAPNRVRASCNARLLDFREAAGSPNINFRFSFANLRFSLSPNLIIFLNFFLSNLCSQPCLSTFFFLNFSLHVFSTCCSQSCFPTFFPLLFSYFSDFCFSDLVLPSLFSSKTFLILFWTVFACSSFFCQTLFSCSRPFFSLF